MAHRNSSTQLNGFYFYHHIASFLLRKESHCSVSGQPFWFVTPQCEVILWTLITCCMPISSINKWLFNSQIVWFESAPKRWNYTVFHNKTSNLFWLFIISVIIWLPGWAYFLPHSIEPIRIIWAYLAVGMSRELIWVDGKILKTWWYPSRLETNGVLSSRGR